MRDRRSEGDGTRLSRGWGGVGNRQFAVNARVHAVIRSEDVIVIASPDLYLVSTIRNGDDRRWITSTGWP